MNENPPLSKPVNTAARFNRQTAVNPARYDLFSIFAPGMSALALNPRPAFGFTSATNPELLPKPEPRALGQPLIVPSIGSRDVAWAQRSNVRRFEHFL
jgi:hypothetical protein